MITIKLNIKYESEEDRDLILDYMRQYNHVYRCSFNLKNEGKKISYKQLRDKLNNIDRLDSWYIQSAIFESGFLVDESNLNKKVIFGGKKNFIKRLKNQITKQEYQLNRLAPLCSYGEKSSGTKHVHGNRKFKLSSDLYSIILKLKERKIIILLPKYIKRNYRHLLTELYKHQLSDDLPITYKLDLNHVYICFDESILKQETAKQIQNRVMSIDMNPNYIGWSVVDWESSNKFNVIKSGVISIKQLNDLDNNLKNKGYSSGSNQRTYITSKRTHETYQISKKLIDIALHYKVQLFGIEDLSIQPSDKEVGKRFNRLVNNQWSRNKLVENLKKRCNIFGIKLLEIEPEYSSFIGNFLFRSLNLPDMVLASIEISRRTYEFYNQYITKLKDIKKNIVQPKIDEFKRFYLKSLEEFKLDDKFKDFKEIYYFFKNSKMMYRVSLESLNLKFCSLFSNKSYISWFI